MNRFDIAVLTTGDELLNGELSDTNTTTIAEVLAENGYRLRCSLSVGDQEKEIADALSYLSSHTHCVIVTGGLGSTSDDLTARAASRALSRPLVINDPALEMIRDWFRRQQRSMPPGNERQALLPQDAEPLPNSIGTAPGFHLRQDGCELFFMPGVPAEMTAMLKQELMPRLQQLAPIEHPPEQRIFKLFGLAEPQIDQMIPYAQLPPGVKVAFGLDYPLVLLKLKAEGEGASERLDQTELLLLSEIGEHIMARDQQSPAGTVAKLLSNAGLRLALAESCTGGRLAAMLTAEAGASAFLERGAVTYADSAKQDWLAVPQAVLQNDGAVSEPCARAMAEGVRRASGSDLSIAITGIAGPDGGSDDKPVGTVFIALDSGDGCHVQRYNFTGDRHKIQLMSTYMALEWLRRFALQQLTQSSGERL